MDWLIALWEWWVLIGGDVSSAIAAGAFVHFGGTLGAGWYFNEVLCLHRPYRAAFFGWPLLLPLALLVRTPHFLLHTLPSAVKDFIRPTGDFLRILKP